LILVARLSSLKKIPPKKNIVYVTISDNASPDVALVEVLLPVLMVGAIFTPLIVSRPF
jgi:hypothetical protein